MKVVEESFKLKLPKAHGRSDGLHISEVIRDYALQAKVLDKKWVRTEPIDEQDTNLMQIGLAWEDYLAAHQHPEIEFHPGEVFIDDHEFCSCGHDRDCHDDADRCNVYGCICGGFQPLRIYMSPDGVSMVDPEDYADIFRVCGVFLHEFKLTKKSSRDFKEMLQQRGKKVAMWIWQMECYALAMNLLAAKLHVMFINGNCSRDFSDPGTQPTYKIFVFTWKREELEEHYKKFRNHARTMISRGQ